MPPRGAQNTWTRESEQDLTLAVVGYLSAEDIKKIKNIVGWDKVTEVMQSWGYQWNKDAMISRWNKKILGDFKKRRSDGIDSQEVHPVAPRGPGPAPATTRTSARSGEDGSKKRSRAQAEAAEHDGDNDLEELDSDEMPMAVKRARRSATAQPAPAGAAAAPGATREAMKKGGDADMAAVDAATDPVSPSVRASQRKKRFAATSPAALPVEDLAVEGEAAPSTPVVSAAAAAARRGALTREPRTPVKDEKPETAYSRLLDDYEI